MLIEAYHTSRSGELRDLVNEIDGTIIFPFSKGLILKLYLNTDEFLNEINIEVEENNVDSEKYISYLKSNEWLVISGNIPQHFLSLLYLLKSVSEKHIVINNERIRFTDIMITENSKLKNVVNVTIQLLISENVITGNY